MGQRYETGIFCQSKDVEHPWLNQAFYGVILHPFPTLGAQFHESPVGMVHHWLNLSSERWTMKCMMQPSPEIVSQFMKNHQWQVSMDRGLFGKIFSGNPWRFHHFFYGGWAGFNCPSSKAMINSQVPTRCEIPACMVLCQPNKI